MGLNDSLSYPELVLIDVDGTMVDSVPDIAWCMDEVLASLDMPRRGEAAVRDWIGNGIERLVKRALLNRMEGEPEPARFAAAFTRFKRLYADNTAIRSRLYPGVRETLDWLKASGYRLGSVTNKAEAFTLPLLQQLGIHNDFDIIVSGDSLPRNKPDPLPLLHAAQVLGAAPSRSLMVGDSKSDIEAARAAGFGIVCLSYGYNHGEDIRDHEPDAVIDSLPQLRALLNDPSILTI